MEKYFEELKKENDELRKGFKELLKEISKLKEEINKLKDENSTSHEKLEELKKNTAERCNHWFRYISHENSDLKIKCVCIYCDYTSEATIACPNMLLSDGITEEMMRIVNRRK